MRQQILAKLNELSAREQITILYACESGSRGWQFASMDSDYDIRFIYLRRIDRYLRIHPVRDVIEVPVTDDLDIVGWDFKKTLQLFQRSNPRLLDWRSAPIVYVKPHPLIEQLWRLAPDYFSPYTCANHYYRSARFYFARSIIEDRMHVKDTFYAMRGVLAVNWFEKVNAPFPMDVWVSIDRLITSAELKNAIQQLYQAKQRTYEQSEIPIIPILKEFCAREIARLEPIVPTFDRREGPDEPLNALFRQAFQIELSGESSCQTENVPMSSS